MTRALPIAVAALALATAAPATPLPRLAHVVVIVFENRERTQVLGNPSAPTFSAYAHRYVDLANYTAVAHPSLPNYLALVSGSTHGIATDCTSCSVRGRSLGSLLDEAHRSWGSYAEGYPDSPRFAKKHVPFLYFPGQQGHVHPLGAFDPRRPPAFAFITPDLCDDGHDCPTSTADAFLARFTAPLLTLPRTVVFVVFDEGTSGAGGGGRVLALALGTQVRPHTRSTEPANHYTLLRTVEDLLGLPHLGASARTQPLTGIWR